MKACPCGHADTNHLGLLRTCVVTGCGCVRGPKAPTAPDAELERLAGIVCAISGDRLPRWDDMAIARAVRDAVLASERIAAAIELAEAYRAQFAAPVGEDAEASWYRLQRAKGAYYEAATKGTPT